MRSLVILFALLFCSSLAVELTIPKPDELRVVSEQERIAAGIPANVCPDSSFTLWVGSQYFCYQLYHPVYDASALPWCPTYGITGMSAIGVYSATTNNMTCPPNTNHVVSTLDLVPPSNAVFYDLCFYKIPVFPQQSQWLSYCYHWADYKFGLGYAFTWKN